MHEGGGAIGLLGNLDRLARPLLPGLEVGLEHDALRAEAVRHRQLGARSQALQALDREIDLALRLRLVAEQPAQSPEPAPRAERGTLCADRLEERDRLFLLVRRLTDVAEQIALHRGRLDHLGPLLGIVRDGFGRIGEPVVGLAVRVQRRRPLTGQPQIASRLLAVVAVAVVARELGDLLLAAVLLDPRADATVQRAPRAEQEAAVRDLVDERMSEDERVLAAAGRDELRALEVA